MWDEEAEYTSELDIGYFARYYRDVSNGSKQAANLINPTFNPNFHGAFRPLFGLLLGWKVVN